MPYKRRYTKGNRRYRRKRYPLTRYNTYRYRSSTAQANQIYRLNKKINAIEYKTKPEIKISYNTYNFNVGDYCNWSFGSLTQGYNLEIQGRLLRIQDITAWWVIYKDPGIVGDLNFTATARVVVYQIKEASASILSAPNTIFSLTVEERQSTDPVVRKNAWMKAIYGPLQNGITARVKILRDFKLELSPIRERVAKKCVIKKGISNIEKPNEVGQMMYPKGTIGWVAITSLNTTDIAAAALKMQSNVKMAYVDES